jgi:hypothetical protein
MVFSTQLPRNPLFTDNGLHETSIGCVMQLFSHMQRNSVMTLAQHASINVYATHQTDSLLLIHKSSSAQTTQIAPAAKLRPCSVWLDVNMSLPDYSMAVLSIHHDGGSETYSFIEPRKNRMAVGQLACTVCGQKVDTLAPTVQC